MDSATMSIAVSRCFLFALVFALSISSANAQQLELSRSDRLAMLYTPQLPFAPSGEPLIKVGLADGLSDATFSSSERFDIMPLGVGGSVIEVPGDRELTITLSDSEPGTYEYGVVVAELTPAQRGEVRATQATWEARDYPTRIAQVGAIFAAAGQRFDTRKTLILVGQSSSRDEVLTLARDIDQRFAMETRLHSELDDYPGGTLTVTGLPGGVTIRHRDLIWVRGGPDTVFSLENVPHDRGTRYEGTEDREYVGALVFSVDRNGALSVVNEVELERLVQGIVPAEVYASAPAAALQAQAIAARSEVLSDLGVRHLAEPYMTCSDQMCQVYRGIGHEDGRTTAAVQATRGMIVAEGDQVIHANFSANNGGFRGDNEVTWGEQPREYLSAVVDTPEPNASYDAGLFTDADVSAFLSSPPDVLADIERYGGGRFRWTTEMTGEELSLAVERRHPGLGPILSLEVLERGRSGRASRMRIEGVNGQIVVERELNIRRALGGLYSAMFVVHAEHAADGIIARLLLTGGGFGHGVGMCQTGAIGAADRGWDARRIIEHYYPGTEIRSLYP
ncbi:MAG: stage II sporulation protein D [Bradymonadia bacterium]